MIILYNFVMYYNDDMYYEMKIQIICNTMYIIIIIIMKYKGTHHLTT